MKKKNLKSVLILFFVILPVLVLTIFVLINVFMIYSAKDYIVDEESELIKGADCILVLGAKVWSTGVPSHILEDRLLTGVDLYKAGVSNALLVSGDNGQKTYNEVCVMKDYVVGLNIPRERVFMDHAGFSTYDSCYRVRDVFCAKKIVIVTQKYHLYRAVHIARSLGLEAYGVKSDRRVIYGQGRRDFREFLARVKAAGAILIKAKPKYLGKKIPITTSSGSATDEGL